jgi:LysR family glycine cleavage system transcriptional activator
VHRLPPLNALRVFEAAARNLSFTRAADELFVTPGAISRQIRSLEDYLGMVLFERNHREVKLTDASSLFAASLTDIFTQLDRASRRFSDSARERQLHISCSITFTLRWLVPRLATFHAKYPKLQMQLGATAPNQLHFAFGGVDLAIQTSPPPPDVIAQRLMGVHLFPVCHPSLLAKDPPLRQVADLQAHTLLRSSARPDDWANWCRAAGATNVDPESGTRFESSSLAYQAALEGIGVAMGIFPLVADDLAAGRLVVPLDFVLDGGSFQLLYRRDADQHPNLTEFREWIVGEAAATEARAPKATAVLPAPTSR